MAAVVLDLERAQALLVDHLEHQSLQVRNLKMRLDVADAPTDVGWDQIEQGFGRLGELADTEIRAQDQDRKLDAGEQIDQIVVDLA